jgi:hypothetical protein
MRTAKLVVLLLVLVTALLIACRDQSVSVSGVSGNWKGSTNPSGYPNYAVTWTMTVSGTGSTDGGVRADGGCTYNAGGNSGGTFLLSGHFDGSHLSLSGGGLGSSQFILDATVSGTSLSGSYTGAADTPCFVYSGTWQGTKQ